MTPSSTELHLADLVGDLKSESVPFVVLIVAALALGAVNYLQPPLSFYEWFPQDVRPLSPFVWWAAVHTLTWVIVPVAVARRYGFGLKDLGLSAAGLASKLWMYGVLYLVTLVFIGIAALQPSFLDTYPFLRASEAPVWSWRLVLAFWVLYSVQFFCVEFFFRGFMIFMLRPRFGYGAIAVMVVPYAMIHFPKPMPEAMAAIVGGTILGWLAFKTRSIWGGVLLHVAVALSMDVLAMLRNDTGFPAVW